MAFVAGVMKLKSSSIRLKIGLLGLSLSLLSCDQTQEIEVGIIWYDDPLYESSATRYLGIVEGEYDQLTGFESPLIDQRPTNPGHAERHLFSFGASHGANYTAFVFIDSDGNGTYDEGYDIVSGYKYNSGDLENSLLISVSSFY